MKTIKEKAPYVVRWEERHRDKIREKEKRFNDIKDMRTFYDRLMLNTNVISARMRNDS